MCRERNIYKRKFEGSDKNVVIVENVDGKLTVTRRSFTELDEDGTPTVKHDTLTLNPDKKYRFSIMVLESD